MARGSGGSADVGPDLPRGDVDGLLAVAAAVAGARAAHVALASEDGSLTLVGTTAERCFDQQLHALCAESVTANRPLVVANPDLRAVDSVHRTADGPKRPHPPRAEPRSHIVLPLRLRHVGIRAVLCIQDARAGSPDRNAFAALDALAAELVRRFETHRLAVLQRDSAESRSRFVDMLIHDAKGVLACLAWQLEGRKGAGQPADGSDALAKASITELMNTLEDIGRIHQRNLMDFEPRIGPHDLKTWFSSLGDRERARANRAGVTLKTTARLNQRHFSTDLRLLDRIAQNLCANALAFSRPGDTVALAIEQLGIGGFTLSVEDEGPGIPDEDLPKIYEPYFTRRRAGGTGLGLSICRCAAAKLGGRLDYTRRQKKGSRFAFTLAPRAHNATNASASLRQPRDLISQICFMPLSAASAMSPGRSEPPQSRARTASLRIASRNGSGPARLSSPVSLDLSLVQLGTDGILPRCTAPVLPGGQLRHRVLRAIRESGLKPGAATPTIRSAH